MKMPVQLRFECVWLALAFLLLPVNLVQAADSAATSKPVLLYSRYFNAEGEDRYLPDGTFKEQDNWEIFHRLARCAGGASKDSNSDFGINPAQPLNVPSSGFQLLL